MKGEGLLKFINKNIAINNAIGMVGGIDLNALRDELIDIIDRANKWNETIEQEARVGRALIAFEKKYGEVNVYANDQGCQHEFVPEVHVYYIEELLELMEDQSGEEER